MTKFLVNCAALLVAVTTAQSWGQNFQNLYSFPANGVQGTKPMAALTIGPDGSLYGTASEAGAGGSGTAFKFNPGTGAFTLLGNFLDYDTGKTPLARLVNIGDGFLYGVTSAGTGTAGEPIGTTFVLNPAGGDSIPGGLTKLFALPGSGGTPMRPHSLVSGEANVLHVLGNSPGGIWRVPVNGDTPTNVFNFPGSGEGGLFPRGIIRGLDGDLYGVTQGTGPGRRGTIFKVAVNGTGFVKLHDCALETGDAPVGAMVQGPDGTFYGTMSTGGTESDGVIFKITPTGEYTVLRNIADHAPTGDLLLASDGRLYGTSRSEGTRLYGSVFRVNTDGSGFQVLVNFDKTNGANPEGGLVQALDGNLYGVTSRGGANDQGTIFRIDLNLPAPEVNRRPIAIADQEFSSGSTVVVNVLSNDFDPDEDDLVVTIVEQPSAGMVEVLSDGSISYAPTSGQYNGFDEFSYKITDPDGLSAVATVTITNQQLPAPFQPGVYNGVVNLDPTLTLDGDTPRGQLVINISESGVFTGKLFTNGKRLTVRGVFDLDSGTAVAVLKISKKKNGLVFLAQGEGNSLIAVVLGQEQLTGFISPLVVPDPAATGSYTAILQSFSPGLPDGFGFAAMRVLPNGLVAVVGKLGDGSKLAWGTTLVSFNGELGVPVFSIPVKNGFVAGNFVATTGGQFEGQLNWFRPMGTKPSQPFLAGFSGEMIGFMDRYVRPAKGELAVDFGPDQAIDLVFPMLGQMANGTVRADGTRLRLEGALKGFSFSKATGLFKGKVKVERKTYSFQGAVTQSYKSGYGYFVIDKMTGSMRFLSDIE